MDNVTLTRRELYDLVWSTPMTSIAEQFGVSSVALAKHCVNAAESERQRAAKRQALADHLVETAERWREAATIREFLSAMSERVPEGSRSPKFARWFAWATEYVEQHDPLAEPDRVAQSLEPQT